MYSSVSWWRMCVSVIVKMKPVHIINWFYEDCVCVIIRALYIQKSYLELSVWGTCCVSPVDIEGRAREETVLLSWRCLFSMFVFLCIYAFIHVNMKTACKLYVLPYITLLAFIPAAYTTAYAKYDDAYHFYINDVIYSEGHAIYIYYEHRKGCGTKYSYFYCF